MDALAQIERREHDQATATFILNEETTRVSFATNSTLLEVLRENLSLTGTKHGCELGECGTCTVLVNDQPVLSCLALAAMYDGARVKTVEGMAMRPKLHPLQQAFLELGAAQCGYCTPGFLICANALLERNTHPTRDEIAQALSGNLCRCTGYLKIFEAVELAASRLRSPEPPRAGS
jgi:carbon-monoxide dehydrogenase small subunit